MDKMINKEANRIIKNLQPNYSIIIFVLNFLFLVIFTSKESKRLFPFVPLIVIFTVLMFAAKLLVKNKNTKKLLGILSFVIYIVIIESSSMGFVYKLVTNKWSFIVIAYILLIDDWLIPLLVGLYPAVQLALLLPKAMLPDSGYIFGQIIGNINGQVAFTISAVLINQMFSRLIIERNRYRALSITDSLTGISNFTHTIETAKKMIQKGNISILLADMDRFKQVNDTYGHVAGNKVLIQIAKLLEAETEGLERILGRLGGDEFIIVVSNDGSQKVLNLGKKLLEIMAEKVFVIDPEIDPIRLSFSVGQANSESKFDDVEKLLHKADVDMYYNKYKIHRLNIFVNKETPVLCNEGYELLNVLAEKDMYTYVHSGYTAQYAAALAKELGYKDDEVESIYTAGWLHDIGKVLISNDIVRKIGSLTDAEYHFMKKHVNYGISILNDLDLSSETLNCIENHHEYWDGSGYPKGLARNDIPPEARVLQIADSYSAMIIKRVYRKTLTPKQALDEITRNAGKQFDPEFVKVFEGLVRNRMEMEVAK